jgi:hypothetical protein
VPRASGHRKNLINYTTPQGCIFSALAAWLRNNLKEKKPHDWLILAANNCGSNHVVGFTMAKSTVGADGTIGLWCKT